MSFGNINPETIMPIFQDILSPTECEKEILKKIFHQIQYLSKINIFPIYLPIDYVINNLTGRIIILYSSSIELKTVLELEFEVLTNIKSVYEWYIYN